MLKCTGTWESPWKPRQAPGPVSLGTGTVGRERRGFAQVAGGGGRGNANLKQALVSRTGGQRGCVCQTSGLATGLQRPGRHNAGSEPAGHVVACGGVSRSGVPRWLHSPSSALLVHAPGSPSPQIPSAFRRCTSAICPHLSEHLLLLWPHSAAPTACSLQGWPVPCDGQGEGCMSTNGHANGGPQPPQPSMGAWESAHNRKVLLPAAVPWWS